VNSLINILSFFAYLAKRNIKSGYHAAKSIASNILILLNVKLGGTF
jgi:hypothetical protein